MGDATEGREGPLEPQHHGERGLTRHEFDEQHARIAEHHQQREARAPGEADLGEIELRLVAGRRLEADDRLRRRPRADARHVRFELAIAAGVARGTTLLEQPDGRQLRVGHQPLLNQRLVAIQLRGTRGGAAGVRGAAQLTIELARPDPVIDRSATDAQLPRDGGLREPRLQIVFEQHEGIPSVHRPAPPTRSRQAPNDEAPTSGPTPDTRSVQFFPAILCNLKSAMTTPLLRGPRCRGVIVLRVERSSFCHACAAMLPVQRRVLTAIDTWCLSTHGERCQRQGA